MCRELLRPIAAVVALVGLGSSGARGGTSSSNNPAPDASPLKAGRNALPLTPGS